jgi:DNA-binding transcriptional ArsR family regulator
MAVASVVAHNAADVAPIAALFADPSRARMIAALSDGRALPASVLAHECGVAASTASGHLARLVDAGVFAVERSGRHRYYRLAGPDVAAAVEALAAIAPQPPVTSLRESTRAAALRQARTCYDHLAGRFGVALLDALIARAALTRTDGGIGTVRGPDARLAAPVRRHPFRLGPAAEQVFADLGIALPPLLDRPASARPLLRFCVDWSEQRYHLAGALGAAVFDRAEGDGWVTRRREGRAVDVTDRGRTVLADVLGAQDVVA